MQAFDPLPPGLDDARSFGLRLITEQLAELKLEKENLVLAGFSQGAMLSSELAIHLPKLGGLVLWSGVGVAMQRWPQLPPQDRTGMKVQQSHVTRTSLLGPPGHAAAFCLESAGA